MLLRSLSLRNYRKYKDVSVEFPDGIIGIIGLNGVGKTTLVESIGWVLFGHHAARTTKELIKREGASPNEPCQVALEFELEGDRYEVVREMVGKNLVPKARLLINGMLITDDPDKVTSVIEEKIGMDYLSFFTSVFARQKELNALSAMKAADRKKLVLRMLGIERIERGIQAIREDKRGKEKRVEGIKAATVDKEGRKKIEILRSTYEEAEITKKSLIPRVNELEAETKVKELEVRDSKELFDRATHIYEQYVALTTTLSERRSDLENVKKQRAEKEKEFNALQVKRGRLEELSSKEAEYFQMREKKEELDAIREKYQRKLELVNREHDTSVELAQRAERISELKLQAKAFEGIESAYEAQMRIKEEMEGLKERYQQKEELLRRKERIQLELRARGEKAERLKSECTAFEGVEEQLELVKKQIEELQRNKEQIHASLGGLKAVVVRYKKELGESRAKKQKIQVLGPEGECPLCERALGSHYETLIEKLEAEIKAKSESLAANFTAYKQKKEELTTLTREEAMLMQREKELDERLARKRALEIELEHEERELRGRQEELEVIGRELEPLEWVTFDEARYKEVTARLTELEQRLTAKKELEARTNHEVRELERWQKELEVIRAELKPLETIEFDDHVYKAVISAIKELEVTYREILGLRAETSRLGEVEGNLCRLREVEEKTLEDLTTLQRQIEALAFDKRDYEEKRAIYERKKEELTELKLRLLEKKNEFQTLCRDIDRIKEEMEEQKRLLEEKENEEREIQYLNALEKLMNDFKVYMVGRIRPMLSDYASEMLRRLTEGKYSALELDENYNIFVYDEGRAYELSRFSGGEEDLANLCLRLAISEVVAERSAIQTNFIILDEIFGSQDAFRKRNIILALHELSRKFRQIFLITHIEDMKDYLEYVLRVTEDEEGVSSVKMGA